MFLDTRTLNRALPVCVTLIPSPLFVVGIAEFGVLTDISRRQRPNILYPGTNTTSTQPLWLVMSSLAWS